MPHRCHCHCRCRCRGCRCRCCFRSRSLRTQTSHEGPYGSRRRMAQHPMKLPCLIRTVVRTELQQLACGSIMRIHWHGEEKACLPRASPSGPSLTIIVVTIAVAIVGSIVVVPILVSVVVAPAQGGEGKTLLSTRWSSGLCMPCGVEAAGKCRCAILCSSAACFSDQECGL